MKSEKDFYKPLSPTSMSSTKYMQGHDQSLKGVVFNDKDYKVVPPEFTYVDPSIKFTSALESQRQFNLKSQENFKKRLNEIREEIDIAMEAHNRPVNNFKRVRVFEKYANEELKSIKRIDQITSIKDLPKGKIVLYDFEGTSEPQKSVLKDVLLKKEKSQKNLYVQIE